MRTFLVKYMEEGQRKVLKVEADDVESALREFEARMDESDVLDWEVTDLLEKRDSGVPVAVPIPDSSEE